MTTPPSVNDWADYWRYEIGVNVITADTKNKRPIVEWKQYQNSPISEEQHNRWKEQDAFKDGMAIIAGRVWHNDAKRDLYLIFIDLDNQIAIDEFCTRNGVKTPLTELAKTVIVEQHKDAPFKAHIIFYASHPFPKKSSDVAALSPRLDSNQVPAIEVKGAGEHGILFCTPSPHKNGHNYEIIGTTELGNVAIDAFESHIDNICSKYGIPYPSGNSTGNGNSITPIQKLFNEDTKIYEGHNRHEALLRVMESLLRRNHAILKEPEIKPLAAQWNQQHCIPPLDDRDFDKQWNDAVKFIQRHNQEQQQQEKAKYPELIGNAYYQINEKPDKYIIAYNQKKQLIEATAKSTPNREDDWNTLERYLVHNKTYLTCIPTKIVRHKNPLTFLDTAPKYTISFVDAVGEKYTFSHKTLSEILSNLRDLGYVMTDGAEGALGAMVQAYKESKEIEDNEDMDYIGFFTDKDNKIIASNIEIIDPSIIDLDDALKFLDELMPYFQSRLDLLATSIIWGIVAPAIFTLKTNNYFLKWLHFHGSPNATKSNTGKIILAIDGHHDDPKFLLNISRIDTIARLGDVVSHTTFPKLVDEVDLNDPRNGWLINALKSAIESRVVRSKFPNNKATSTVDIPALTPAILTSNAPPPFNDSAYMRRVIERNFPQSETYKENDSIAIEFKEFLRSNLKRLKPLGDLRNWYIVNKQEKILDEARPAPLDLGFTILSEAYKKVGRAVPYWLSLRLPENQLEESIDDNGVIVKNAFEKYIIERLGIALSLWRSRKEPSKVSEHSTIKHWIVELAYENLLPAIKKMNNGEIIIRKGILDELYRQGVTRDQLPNLKALADYMGATYRKSEGNKVVACTETQLSAYFDEIEDQQGQEQPK